MIVIPNSGVWTESRACSVLTPAHRMYIYYISLGRRCIVFLRAQVHFHVCKFLPFSHLVHKSPSANLQWPQSSSLTLPAFVSLQLAAVAREWCTCSTPVFLLHTSPTPRAAIYCNVVAGFNTEPCDAETHGVRRNIPSGMLRE